MKPLKPHYHKLLSLLVIAFVAYACSSSSSSMQQAQDSQPQIEPKPLSQIQHPNPDPREGLEAGLFDAGEATWNLNKLASKQPPEDFVGVTNSDLAFKGDYAIQGNYNGVIFWDISDPSNPKMVKNYLCPASQSDVSVYNNLLFVSGEGLGGRLDCGTEGVDKQVSEERLRGIRIFDISDINNPEYIANVQTCRGSHTHSLLTEGNDPESIYVYVSGSAPVRPEEELPGCSSALPSEDPNSALFRIEVIEVPLDNPSAAKIVSSPRIFEGLTEAPTHGLSEADKERIEEAKAQGKFVVEIWGTPRVLSDGFVERLFAQRGVENPTAADSASLREDLPAMIAEMVGDDGEEDEDEVQRGPNQCHDITLYPAIGLAGGACEGYGLLLDISDPTQPTRIAAVADSNFSYWHSATFSNDGNKILFTDEWGGGGQPKCREKDPMEWGANAIFTIDDDNQMNFESYYKISAAQTSAENCVAHNGSLIPIPGRDIMVQSWYQGGISIFDWTDPENPVEIAFHDRGPVQAGQMQMGGSWSVYWYNGVIVSSEIARGLDIFELEANPYLTQNEIDAANTVVFEQLNPQDQPHYSWPATFALARAYIDQLDRNDTMSDGMVADVRARLNQAEAASGGDRSDMLRTLADDVEGEASSNKKAQKLAETLRSISSPE
ncbi:MAG: hypothetical protein JXR26_06220 [Balneolaceae bacterium]|nr:hypothetical protein [Balneolaceae bacterium]